jgi:hypothetical protein
MKEAATSLGRTRFLRIIGGASTLARGELEQINMTIRNCDANATLSCFIALSESPKRDQEWPNQYY